MGNKNNVGTRHFQTDIHHLFHSKTYTPEQSPAYKFTRLRLYWGNSVNHIQMGESVKVLLNTIGLTTFIMGILANINNLLSVLLACIGIVWGIVKCLEKWEDYQLKKWERLQKQEEKKRRERLPKAS